MAERVAITSEKGLEDYICKNQKEFIKILGKALNVNPELITFIGRQIVVGTQNRIDLLYFFDKPHKELIKCGCEDYFIRYVVIVELKFRKLHVNDINQVARYADGIYSCETLANGVMSNEPICVLVGLGIDNELERLYGSGIIDTKSLLLIEVSPDACFEKRESQLQGTEVNTIDCDLKSFLQKEPRGYMTLEELKKRLFSEKEKQLKGKEDEHDRVLKTPQET